MMQAAVLHAPGPASAFQIEDVPMPMIGPEDVLVQVANCGVSYHDVVERNGTYRRDVEFPVIIGLEIGGIVVECGSAVPELQPGDHVCSKAFASCGRCRLCRSGMETTCSARRPVRGGYGEYAALPWDALVRVPKQIALEKACIFGPVMGVALNAVRDVAQVRIGEDVLVTGGTGGVGWPSVQIAKLCGSRVIATTRSVEKRSALLEAGADVVVVAEDRCDFSAEVKDATDGKGVDVVVDNVGSRVFLGAFNSLVRHGRYAFVGQLFEEEISINPARIFFKRAQLLGVGSVSRAQIEDVIALTLAHKLVPKISAVLPLDQVADAHQMVEDARMVGRVLLAPMTDSSVAASGDSGENPVVAGSS